VLDEVAHEPEIPVVGRAVESGLPVGVGVGRVDVEAELDHQRDSVGPVSVGGDTDLVRAPATGRGGRQVQGTGAPQRSRKVVSEVGLRTFGPKLPCG
jgi:hypothetical protein